MLIRSQNKAILLNFSNSTVVYIVKNDKDFVILSLENENRYRLGKYSSEAKAMKVLNMIQEAYANAKLVQETVPNIGKMFAEASASKENELLAKAIGEALMKEMVFQMPEDSEV